jgi:ribonuclease H / adenosylcobalamin/alpha-ribazole phosphatase
MRTAARNLAKASRRSTEYANAAPADALPADVSGVRHSILLIRHASTAWTGRRWCGRADPPLNTTGRREAVSLAGALASELAPAVGPAATIRTSPAQRAISTAAAIAAAAGIDLEADPDLVEVDLGDAEGLTWDELATRHPAVAQRVLAREPVDWPGGEPHESLLARASRAAERIGEVAASRPVLVVSHGYVLEVVGRFLDPYAEAPAVLLGPADVRRLPPTP